jgi:nicotinamide-nucleotide amidase
VTRVSAQSRHSDERAGANESTDALAEDAAHALEGRTVATAESCTAGRVVAALAVVEHASQFVRGGLVAYQEQVKRTLLDVDAPSVYGTDAVAQMARGVALLLDADVAVATSGVVGDEPVEGTQPGTVYVGTVVDGDLRATVHQVRGDPETMCAEAVRAALRRLRDHAFDRPIDRRPRSKSDVAG